MSVLISCDSAPHRAVVSWTGTASGSASGQAMALNPVTLAVGTYAFTVTKDGVTLASVSSVALIDTKWYSIPLVSGMESGKTKTLRQLN